MKKHRGDWYRLAESIVWRGLYPMRGWIMPHTASSRKPFLWPHRCQKPASVAAQAIPDGSTAATYWPAGHLDTLATLRYCPAAHVIQVEPQMPKARFIPSCVLSRRVSAQHSTRTQNSSDSKSHLSWRFVVFTFTEALSYWRRSPDWQKLQSYALIAALLLAAIFATAPAISADDWLPISPDELKMISDPKAPGAPAIYLYRQVDRSDFGRAGNERNYIRIKILNEAGRDYANIEIPYRDRMSISNIRARTVRRDGSIVNFDGQVFKTTTQKNHDSKLLAKSFTVPDVQVGSIVEYRFTYDFEDNWIFDSEWIISAPLFTKKALFTLRPFERWQVQWSWPAGLPDGATKPVQGNDSMVRMTAENIPAFEEEEFMPPPNELKYRVNFAYSQDGFESDQNKYWNKFGKKENDRVEAFADKRKAMAEAVATIVSPSDTPEVKLQKIYDRCQQLRNLSYEPRISKVEVKHDKMKLPENAEEVWKLGYGNGGQITWLFLGLARAAGLDAHPALVAGRAQHFFNPQRMNSGELTANLVVVKLNGKDIFCDPGAAFTPYGLLPWVETGASGRLLDKDGGTWVETPLPPSAVTRIERVANLQLDEDGSLEGKVTVTYTGLEAQAWRVDERNEDDAARKRALEEGLKHIIPAACEVELKNAPEWNGSKTPVVAEFEVKIPGWLSTAGKRELLPTGFFVNTEKHLFEHSTRTFPVYFRFPILKTDEITIALPQGWKVDSELKPLNQDAKAIAYSFSAESKQGTVHVQRSIRTDIFLVPADKYSILRSFYQYIRTADDQQIVLIPGAAVAAN
jgi:Domain of Unknown Function with PDB structure (DUF3857)